MDEKVLQQAVDDISVIKGVIERTGKSFVSFSKIFIYWGILFIFNSIINTMAYTGKFEFFSILYSYPVVNFIFPVALTAIAAILIYRHVSKKIPLVGLEKQLMKIWLLILIMNVIPPKVSIAAAEPSAEFITIHTDLTPTLFFSLAVALIATSLFTGYRQLKYTGAVYVLISLLYAYVIPASANEITLLQLPYILALPFTFIYTGLFLKSRQARSE